MKTSLFYLPGVGTKAQIEAGNAALRGTHYDDMLAAVLGQCQLADELGYNSVSFTEHHFHSEGFEVSNNPVLLDLYVGLQTKRLRVGQLGVVLPANNPIRVAEDIAMLDHMTGGRANAGFARGYQRRWVDTMAQQTHGIHGAQPHQHDKIDAANRAAFEECFHIIKEAWTKDYINYQGKYWQVPVKGTPWSVDATKKWGEGVENDIVTKVGVVPKPLQKTSSTDLPTFCQLRAHDSVVCSRRHHARLATTPPDVRTATDRCVRGSLGQAARRRHWSAARRCDRRFGRRGHACLEQWAKVLC